MRWLRQTVNTGFVGAFFLGSACALLAGSMLSTVANLRLMELRDNLQAANEKSDEVRNVALLSRVALINQRAFSGGREDATQYRQEAESALITIKQTRGRSRQASLADRLALPFLNGMNRILALPRLKIGATPEQELVLDLAFQFESYREYAKAVRAYTVYLTDFSLSELEKDFALLHRGFCYAMLNQFEAAIADFSAVESSTVARNAETAGRLHEFLKKLQERIRIIESIQDPARRGELYYAAAAYAKALENFAQVEELRRSTRIRFLIARSLEETGQTAQALAIYRELVKTSPGSAYALNANRRMYLLGTFLGHDEKLAAESRRNAESVVQDKEFIAALTHLEKSALQLHREAAAEKTADEKELAAVERALLPETPVAPTEPKVTAKPLETPPQPIKVKPIKKPEAIPDEFNLRTVDDAVRAEALPEEKKETLLRSQKEEIDKLTMTDGNVFYGVVYQENEESIWLFTLFGNLDLKKADIVAREKVSGSSAIK